MAAGDVDKPIRATAALQPNLSSRSHTTPRHRMQAAGAVRHPPGRMRAGPRSCG